MESFPGMDRTKPPNPGVNTYRTADDRFISFILLQPDKHWAAFADRLGRPELKDDPKFVDAAARAENTEECTRIIRANVHLVPDADLPTLETGIRHRTAERVSLQTEALVVAISQSGESPDIVGVVEEGYRQGAPTLAITNKMNSPLARAAHAADAEQDHGDARDRPRQRLSTALSADVT